MAGTTGKRAGVIGLGAMGFGMASSLARAGFEVAGYDPSPAAQDRAREVGIAPKASPEEVFAAAEVIVLSLPTAAHVEGAIAAARGAGLLGAPRPRRRTRPARPIRPVPTCASQPSASANAPGQVPAATTCRRRSPKPSPRRRSTWTARPSAG
ncbi:NAD(P)-binding domain-containing protein [Mangrovicoccus ximenensis]|uniref:NAD(P)-binding domain-containing protein n=1 Tax=Mangrovicoccus ximenensis TaxID=1911570 RepID=UPI0022AAE26B|nr:NAD(P)-binding domain-containing protein [Mangrovicoccus ximenensis]